MIDGIKAFYRSQEAHDRLLLENKQGLVFSGQIMTGAVDKHSGKDDGMYVDVFEPTKDSLQPGISLRGSLHCYWKGHNDGLFKYKEVVKAITDLCHDYHVDPNECEVHSLEFGVNIKAKCPEAFINSAILYHGKTGVRNPHKKFFGKTWDWYQYQVKLYKKGPHRVRYELKIKEMAKLNSCGIYIENLSDLCDRTNFVKLLRILYESVNEILFVPSDREHRLPKKEEAKWNAYRSDSFWEELNSDQKYRASCRVKKLTQLYRLIRWDSFLKHGIIYEGSRMLETSPWGVSAMFSAHGLHAKTVAGPNRGRDRLAENKASMTILVRIHLLEAYLRCTTNVIISPVLSYEPLYPRGPPSYSFAKLTVPLRLQNARYLNMKLIFSLQVVGT